MIQSCVFSTNLYTWGFINASIISNTNLSYFTESKHCPVASECRALLRKSDECQMQVILKQFDCVIDSPVSSCRCCYNCIEKHSQSGCLQCTDFLNQYFPQKRKVTLSIRVSDELKLALNDLFEEMGLTTIKVEENLALSPHNFITDLLRAVDEIKCPLDVKRLWHVSMDIAIKVFMTIKEVVFDSKISNCSPRCDKDEDDSHSSSEESVSSSDELVESSDDESDMYSNSSNFSNESDVEF